MSDNSNEVKHYAPNKKSAWLQEVEDDATYITNKRFAEQREEAERERQKRERDEAKANKPQPGGATYTPDETKGK